MPLERSWWEPPSFDWKTFFNCKILVTIDVLIITQHLLQTWRLFFAEIWDAPSNREKDSNEWKEFECETNQFIDLHIELHHFDQGGYQSMHERREKKYLSEAFQTSTVYTTHTRDKILCHVFLMHALISALLIGIVQSKAASIKWISGKWWPSTALRPLYPNLSGNEKVYCVYYGKV